MGSKRGKTVIALLLCFALVVSQLVFANEKVEASYMPLEETYGVLDLTGMTPNELKEVSYSDIVSKIKDTNGNPISLGGDIVAYALNFATNERGLYSNNNIKNYSYFDSTEKINFVNAFNGFDGAYSTIFNMVRITYAYSIELIIGTYDQLNKGNKRVLLEVKTTPWYPYSMDVRLNDESRTEVTIKSLEYTNISGKANETDTFNTAMECLLVCADERQWSGDGEAYITFYPNDAFSGIDVRIYEGTSMAPEDEITSVIWKDSQNEQKEGYLHYFSGTRVLNENGTVDTTKIPVFTFVLEKNGELIDMCYLYVAITNGHITITPGTLAVTIQGGEQYMATNAISEEYGEINEFTYPLWHGLPIDGDYYVCLGKSYTDKDGRIETSLDESWGWGCVDSACIKAVEGSFDSLEAASGQKDIQQQLVKSNVGDIGYKANFINGETFFTFFFADGTVQKIKLRIFSSTHDSDYNEFNKRFYLHSNGVAGFKSYTIPSNADGYIKNGFETILILNTDGTAVAENTSIIPTFTTPPGSVIYSGQNGVSGNWFINGTSEINFKSGEANSLIVISQSGEYQKNYWVTYLTRQTGPKLFINGINDQRVASQTDGTTIPKREVTMYNGYMSEWGEAFYGYYHDVFIANIGDEDITGLYVRLENPKNIKLDDYWTIGSSTTLSAFTTTEKAEPNGELENIAKIRLLPENPNTFGDISGTLVIGYTGDGSNGEEYRIQLTGSVGTPEIVTETMVDGVKFVPYQSIIQNNSMYASDHVSYSVTGGSLPTGLSIKNTGEIYGVPRETGDFTFTVTMSYQMEQEYADDISTEVSKTYTITIKDNTDEEVEAANEDEQGYSVIDYIDKVLDVSTASGSALVFHSEGAFNEFTSLYLDGRELVRDEEYSAEEGSTKITIFEQTFENAGNGTHTIAAEFHVGGTLDGLMKRSAQNLEVVGVITQEPEEPSQPSQPGEPSQPSQPEEPEQPSQPGNNSPSTPSGREVIEPDPDDKVVVNSDGSVTKTKEVKNSDGSVTVEKVTTAQDGTVITERIVERPDGTRSVIIVKTDKDGNELSRTTEEVTFTEAGTKVEEKKTTNADSSSEYSLVKTKKSGKIDSLKAKTNSKGKMTLEVGTVKANGSEIKKKYVSKADGTIKLTKYETTGPNAVIPSTLVVDGKKFMVSAIAHDTFAGNENITNVKLGKNIVAIGKRAFENMPGMKKIIVYSTKIENVGKGAFIGIADGAVFKLKMDKENYLAIRELFSAAAEKDVEFKRVK